MLQTQWMQWLWLGAILVVLALAGYGLMKFLRYKLHQMAKRTVTDLDDAVLRWVDDISGVLRIGLILVVGILGAFIALRSIGHPAAAGLSPASVMSWFLEHGVRLVLLVVGAYLALKFAHMLLSKAGLLIQPYDESASAEIERQKRAETISSVLQRLATVIIVLVTILMLLGELGVNTTPLLTSLGVIGVALGFGAQQLVGDLLAGCFHIFENQIRIGDVAVINGTGGAVQEIHLRTTVLRSLDGTVHVFRNGSISTLSNMTKRFSYYVVDLGVAYKEDTDRVCQVVREVVDEMQQDEQHGASILEPVEILGVDSFADSAVVIKLRIKTLPVKQWEVGREFRRRIKYRFDQEGIEIPFPHLSVYMGEASKPFRLNVENGAVQMAAAKQ